MPQDKGANGPKIYWRSLSCYRPLFYLSPPMLSRPLPRETRTHRKYPNHKGISQSKIIMVLAGVECALAPKEKGVDGVVQLFNQLQSCLRTITIILPPAPSSLGDTTQDKTLNSELWRAPLSSQLKVPIATFNQRSSIRSHALDKLPIDFLLES